MELANIKLLATDFDGIWTDGKVYVGEDGAEQVCCDRRDSLLLPLLHESGVEVCVISKETNPVVAARCRKMRINVAGDGVPCFQAVESGDDKLAIAERLAIERNISLAEVAFMGDDINDLSALRAVGYPITVSDGHTLNQAAAAYITGAKGGHGAVREVTEQLLAAKGVSLTA